MNAPHTERTLAAADLAPGRLWFLDWVRILAFFLLILYHTGMYYVTWDWHVKSPHASAVLEPFMMLSSPWRLGLLFLVSGAASAFLFGKTSAGTFLRQRSWRLLVPLAFGMFVIVPPQPYFEVVEKVAYAGSYADFYALYLQAYHGFCRGQDCLDLPTWNHLWFVAYLWAYTVALVLLAVAAGSRIERWSATLAGWLTGWRALVLPALLLAGVRLLLVARFRQTHALVDDWYNHAQYFSLFLLGFLMAKQPRFWNAAAALRWPALATGVALWGAWVVYMHAYSEASPPPDALRLTMRFLHGFLEWAPMLAACGFARVHLDRDGPARRYLVPAVFPVYIVHQTLIVVMAHLFKPAAIPPVTEGIVLVALTFVGCFAVYEIVRRVAVLRPAFGLGPVRGRGGQA